MQTPVPASQEGTVDKSPQPCYPSMRFVLLVESERASSGCNPACSVPFLWVGWRAKGKQLSPLHDPSISYLFAPCLVPHTGTLCPKFPTTKTHENAKYKAAHFKRRVSENANNMHAYLDPTR